MAKKKPVTTHRAVDLFTMADPRKYKKLFFRDIFNKNKEAYEEFLIAWDEAIKSGARYTFAVAMIRFRQYWDDETGDWCRKLPDGVELE